MGRRILAMNCSVDGCENTYRIVRGYCNKHYVRFRTGRPLADPPPRPSECFIAGCVRPILAKGLCQMHYERVRTAGRAGEAEARWHRQALTCSITGCGGRTESRGWCGKHYRRFQVHGDPFVVLVPKAPKGAGAVTAQGYRMLGMRGHAGTDKNGRIPEHRLVMATTLGRTLLPGETVHHRNGDRLDNRPENLELWVTRHPFGQRVEDQVRWARDILARYGDLYPEGSG